MKKSFYILSGLLAASLFSGCGDENAVSATESSPSSAKPTAAVVVETPVVEPTGTAQAPKVQTSNILESAETDLAKAIDLAKKENRSVLVEFTGSDWCPPCKMLRKEILSKPEFSKFVTDKNIIFVELDFPRTPGKVPEEVMREREKILTFYGVQGFPTMLLLDKNGAAYAQIVGGAKDIPEYIQRLEEACILQKRFFEAVDQAQGKPEPERVEALALAVKSLKPEFQAHQKDLIAAIIAADKEDRFGLAAKRREAVLEVEQREMLKQFFSKHRGKKDPEPARLEAIELLKNKDLLPRARCELNKYISDGYAMQGNLQQALVYLKTARDCVAGTDRGNKLERWIKQLETVIESQKASEAKAEAQSAEPAKPQTTN